MRDAGDEVDLSTLFTGDLGSPCGLVHFIMTKSERRVKQLLHTRPFYLNDNYLKITAGLHRFILPESEYGNKDGINKYNSFTGDKIDNAHLIKTCDSID